MLSKQDLKLIMPEAWSVSLDRFCDPLNVVMEKYEINTPMRQACFLAQVGEESGSLNYTRELWGPTPLQQLYERDFSHAWPPTAADPRNKSAWSLGNIESGDGKLFRGRGIFQETGRSNYQALKEKFGVDFIAHPELLEGPVWACESAGDFWKTKNLNAIADTGSLDAVSDTVNIGHKTIKVGDALNYAKRLAFFNRAKQVLHIV